MPSHLLTRIILGVASAAVALSATLPPMPRNALLVNVTQKQILANGSNWRTSWGSYSKEYANQRILIVNLKQLGRFDPSVSVAHYFIGRDLSTRKFVVYSQGEQKANVDADGDEFVIVPKEIQAKSEREKLPPHSGTVTSGSGRTTETPIDGKTMPAKKSGVTPHGWCILVTQGGKTVGETASTPELVKWTKDYLATSKPAPPKP